MDRRRMLLRNLIRENPFQPATSWWRAVELDVVADRGLPAGRGLDVGCGDGKLMRILLDACATAPTNIVGVDIDPLETRDAISSGVYRAVHTTPAGRIPEPDSSFDFAISNSVLEHIDDLDPVLAEVARVLRPGGTFLFTVPSAGFHECLAGPLLPWIDRSSYLREIDRRCAHKRYWNDAQWRESMHRHGLRLDRTRPYLSVSEVQRWETLSRFTAGALYVLASRRRQPIEIQRALGLRRRTLRLPTRLSQALAALLSSRLSSREPTGFGCLLLEGRKAG